MEMLLYLCVVINHSNNLKFTIMQNSKTQMYFRFNCDRKDRIKLVPSDIYFDLHEFNLVIEYKQKLDSLGYDYDFLIEEFDHTNHTISSNNYIVRKNYLNNL